MSKGSTWGCHLGIKIPRLYRKKTGTYFLRIVLPKDTSSCPDTGRKRNEVRRSLRTKDVNEARRLATLVNARLENDRHIVAARTNQNLNDLISTWTLGNGQISASDDDDQRRLQRFLNDNPAIRDAFVAQLSSTPPANNHLAPPALVDPAGLPPRNPLRLSPVISRYTMSKMLNGDVNSRTAEDQGRLLKRLATFIGSQYPELTDDPLVHQIKTHHIAAFFEHARSGQIAPQPRTGRQAKERARSPATQLKMLSDLRTFFSFAHKTLEATTGDPTEPLRDQYKGLRAKAAKTADHYAPFTSAHLQRIFSPKDYIAFNRDADYFWAPLIALHLGTRLKEIVTFKLDAIAQDQFGIWYVEVMIDDAKNLNSARKIPIPEKLLELGFIDYVEHVRALGATHLFPHRDAYSKTSTKDPSKYCSRQFGLYLDDLGIKDKNLVFHSFRHTVVSALRDGNTPLSDSMQLVGHIAQEAAIRTGELSAYQARSVHIGTYTHASQARLNVENPLSRLKEHLDRCIQVPIDYEQLKHAALVVRENTKLVNGSFSSGWSKLGSYAKEVLDRFADSEPGSKPGPTAEAKAKKKARA